MNEKPKLIKSDNPPNCPHCKADLRNVHWHKVDGTPSMMSYLILFSCPHCRAMLGSAAH